MLYKNLENEAIYVTFFALLRVFASLCGNYIFLSLFYSPLIILSSDGFFFFFNWKFSFTNEM